MNVQTPLRRNEQRSETEEIRCTLVVTELELAMAFCRMALETLNPDGAERNIASAKFAYDHAIRLMQKTNSAVHESEEIRERIQDVIELARELDCVF
jgi:hypothetical protein